MRWLQFISWLSLIPFTHGLAMADSNLPQITPPPQLIQRNPGIESISVAGSVCGYVNADYSPSNSSVSETKLMPEKDHQSPVPLG